jgi:streptomycin 6-kinase
VVDDLATATQYQLDQWELHRDGETRHGSGSIVLQVRTSDGARAVLKISLPDAASEHEHLVLRRWGGNGAVRLLRADPRRRALLLERLRPDSLTALTDVEACEIVAGLYPRIHVPAMPQLPALTSYVERWTSDFESLPRSAPIPHRLVEQAIVLGRELADGPTNSVVHGDLDYGSVLAADREPWLVIAPKPMNGDPHFDLAPMLWSRWGELTGNIRDGVRRRFYTLIDAAGLDEDRARAWVVVRVVLEATRELGNPTSLTKFIALAKAVQD